MLTQASVKDFLAKTSSSDPVPGGGSVSSLAGAAGAALAKMVADLTLGNKKFAQSTDEMEKISKKAAILMDKLILNVDEDAKAYDRVIAAFRLPRSTDGEKEKRSAKIQEAFKHAALVPLEVAKASFEVMEMAGKAMKLGNPNALSDALVGIMMARTAVMGALYNVKINLGSIKDKEFVRKMEQETKDLRAKTISQEEKLLSRAF